MRGIDVSQHNGWVNFEKVKAAGYEFVMIRSGYGNSIAYPKQRDPRFEENYRNAKAAGMKIGIYHYLYATTTQAAEQEAKAFLKEIKGKTPLPMPIALDIEEKSQYVLTNATVEAIVKAFMDIMENAGYYCVLYSYEAFLTAKMSKSFRERYDVWCANISRTPSIKYGIHQYSFTGSVAGVNGACDLNKTYVDYPKRIKTAGLNGYKKPKKEPKTLDSDGLRKGNKGIGVYAFKRLLKLACDELRIECSIDTSGGFGGGTENAVNAVLKSLGYKQNGIAGKKFIGKLEKIIGG